MDKDSRLYKWLLQQQRKTDAKDGMGTGFKHRAAYHKEFRGYAEIRIPTDNGHFKIERVYIAPWYKHEISDKSWVLLKLFYVIGLLASAALFVMASLQSNYCNSTKVMGLFQFIVIIALAIYLARIAIFMITPRKMTAGQCDGVDKPLTRWAFVAFAAGVPACIWNFVVVLVINKGMDFIAESRSMFMLWAMVIILLAMWLVQRKMTFEMLDNSAALNPDLDTYEIK